MEQMLFIPLSQSGWIPSQYYDDDIESPTSFLSENASDLKTELSHFATETYSMTFTTGERTEKDFEEYCETAPIDPRIEDNWVLRDTLTTHVYRHTQDVPAIPIYCNHVSKTINAGGKGTQEDPFLHIVDAISYAKCILEHVCDDGFTLFLIKLKGTVKLDYDIKRGTESFFRNILSTGRIVISRWGSDSVAEFTTKDDVDTAGEAELDFQNAGEFIRATVFDGIKFKNVRCSTHEVSEQYPIFNILPVISSYSSIPDILEAHSPIVSPVFIANGKMFVYAFGKIWNVGDPSQTTSYVTVQGNNGSSDSHALRRGDSLYGIDSYYGYGMQFSRKITQEDSISAYTMMRSGIFSISDEKLYDERTSQTRPISPLLGWKGVSCGTGYDSGVEHKCFAVRDDVLYLVYFQSSACREYIFLRLANIPGFETFVTQEALRNNFNNLINCDFEIPDISRFKRDGYEVANFACASVEYCNFTIETSVTPNSSSLWNCIPSLSFAGACISNCSMTIDLGASQSSEEASSEESEEGTLPFLDIDWPIFSNYSHLENCNIEITNPVLYDEINVFNKEWGWTLKRNLVYNSNIILNINAKKIHIASNMQGVSLVYEGYGISMSVIDDFDFDEWSHDNIVSVDLNFDLTDFEGYNSSNSLDFYDMFRSCYSTDNEYDVHITSSSTIFRCYDDYQICWTYFSIFDNISIDLEIGTITRLDGGFYGLQAYFRIYGSNLEIDAHIVNYNHSSWGDLNLSFRGMYSRNSYHNCTLEDCTSTVSVQIDNCNSDGHLIVVGASGEDVNGGTYIAEISIGADGSSDCDVSAIALGCDSCDGVSVEATVNSEAVGEVVARGFSGGNNFSASNCTAMVTATVKGTESRVTSSETFSDGGATLTVSGTFASDYSYADAYLVSGEAINVSGVTGTVTATLTSGDGIATTDDTNNIARTYGEYCRASIPEMYYDDETGTWHVGSSDWPGDGLTGSVSIDGSAGTVVIPPYQTITTPKT